MEKTQKTITPEEQNRILGQTLEVQSALTQVILHGGSLDVLVRALAEALFCSVVLEDPRLEPLAACSPQNTAHETPGLYISVQTSPSFMSLLRSKRLQKEPVQITEEFPGYTVYRIVSAIHAGSERLGFLSLLQVGKPFPASDMICLKHAAGFFAMQLAQDRKIAEIELRLKGNFVEDLTGAKYSDPDSILNRARALDYNILLPHRVLVAEIDNMKQIAANLHHNQKELLQFKTELVRKIQNQLDLSVKGMVIHKNDEIVMLVSQEKADSPINASKQFAEALIEEISPIFKVKLFIGIGSICSELSDYQQSYLAAKKALEIGAFMITEGQVRSLEQFRSHALFLSTLKPAELYNYARSQLGALLDYDDLHKTELLKTLQEFLYLRNNIEGTAKSISMSVSGLKYRLEKIEKIIGQELKDYKVSFDLQLALIILQLFGEYRIKQ